MTWSFVAESVVTLAAFVEPNTTFVTRWKLVPVIVSFAPGMPFAELSEVIFGGAQ